MRNEVELEEGSPDDEAQPRKQLINEPGIRQPSFSESIDEEKHGGSNIETISNNALQQAAFKINLSPTNEWHLQAQQPGKITADEKSLSVYTARITDNSETPRTSS